MVMADKGMEFEGHDVADAIKKALKALGVSRETITVRVLSEEQKGLFSMNGLKPAKIKVSMKAEHAEEPLRVSAVKKQQ